MNNVLIDDRRIKVDFSQSVYHLWRQYRRFGKLGGREDEAVDDTSAIEVKRKESGKQKGYGLMLDQKKLEKGALKRRNEDDRHRSCSNRDEEDPSHRRRDMDGKKRRS